MKAYTIMECDTVVGASEEDVIRWYHQNICDLDSEDVESIEEEDVNTRGIWYPSDSETEYTKDSDKVSLGDTKRFEGLMYEYMTIQKAFDLETDCGKNYTKPFVIASKEV